MKYTFLFVFLLGFSSCSLLNSLNTSSSGSVVSNTNVGGVQVSDSGVFVSSGSENTSIDSSGNILIRNNSGNIFSEHDGTSITSNDNTMVIGKNGLSVGTGISTSRTKADNLEKDPEVQNIQKDIDAIFSDIEKGGK